MAEELNRNSIAPEDDAIAAGAQVTGSMRTIAVMDRTTFADLASHPADVCVTIYLTTHGSGVEVNEQTDKKALKDALSEARRSMEELKIEGIIDDILRPAEQLLKDDGFWHHQTHGLALFLAPDTHSCCLLPYDPGSMVHVHTAFILLPLVPILVDPWSAEQRRKAFQNKADQGAAPVTTFLQDVIRAAYEGRIAQLFVAKGQLVWGHYTDKPEEPVMHKQEEPGDDCLTNQAVVQTILHGGEAYMVDQDKMPAGGEMAAVLRYS
ncbi:MAG TPA: hypothetical protein VGS79_10125 [Puia sp.]|nr:hypothetical protein [Puia sp.]